MILSIYSSEGWYIDFYDTKFTKLGSNKEKANITLIWAIILHNYKAKIIFSVCEFVRIYAS